MRDYSFESDWFVGAVVKHGQVNEATVVNNRIVSLSRKDLPAITVAPVATERIDQAVAEQILDMESPTIIVLIRRASHYDWDARVIAENRGSTIHTFKELFTFLGQSDPRSFVDKNVAYARRSLRPHSRVLSVDMICESSMRLVRTSGLSEIVVAIEYQYEFSEESLVSALDRHPNANAILNMNPNGRPTKAALSYAEATEVPVFRLAELMGALNYDGRDFRNYQPPKDRR